MTVAVRGLRVVTEAELRQYLKDHAATNGLARPPWVASANATRKALASDESSARADAERLVSEIPGGACVKPYQVDLGALSELGQWEDICRFGAPGSSSGGLQLHATSDGPSLVFGPGPAGLDVCYRQVGDTWWITHGPGEDPAAPCPDGYTFVGA